MDELNDIHDDERTPLLERQSIKQSKTPLDKLQLGIILLGTICEPICSQSIYPFINELVSKLDIVGGDETKVGYYAGLIESLFFATEALTVFQWSRLSDRVGRKPILMLGMMGTIISMLAFGLSRTFWALVISRCLCGLLNGNIGVMKSTMGELTDNTNRADAFALMPALWAFGATMGPLLGGTLTRPADQFPDVFKARFWTEYPYFLPCAAPAAIVFMVLVITGTWFKETVTWKKENAAKPASPLLLPADELIREYDDTRITLSSLLTFPVVISIANYMTLAFLNIATNALLPLFFHMPIELGGLDLDPILIGYAMGVYGLGTGAFQIFFFARIVRRLGTRRTFIMSMAAFVPVFLMFPIISILAKDKGVFWGVWALVGLMFGLLFFMDTAYGCIFIYVTESAPNRYSLGATNGLAQTTVSTARAIGPVLSTSLFSFSVRHDIMGGYGVYLILTGIAILALALAIQLPSQTWAKQQADST
ncbi:major facilitator superfamily transporter [Pholiota conissans]|uniref:Major facilitator superfamily transporter n=1 Tax=Pholiota conissans TaxID=109636 RepID=A0A9P5Z4N1_9AGAR|nr:major facilitator superfamily transporter [Pholiota conissans]